MKKKRRLTVLAFVAVLFSSTEVFLRQYYGFCGAVLYEENPTYEYIIQPNQHRFRFRNHIDYNSKSMRSEEVDTTSYIILGFGDSVINGGVQTDQDSLATTILSDSLSKLKGRKVQFLNISAGGWDTDNCYAYLEKHGDFGAKSIFLFVNSQDAHNKMEFRKIVGLHENYPNKQYLLALHELVDRYLIPMLNKSKKTTSNIDNLQINKTKGTPVFNPAFMSFLSYSKEKNIPFVICLHASREEVKLGSYNQQGQEIIAFAKENNIPLILDLENGISLSDFFDYIHINSKGQRKLAKSIIKYCMNTLKPASPN